MKRTAWSVALIVFGFTAAWIIQEFRMGHLENVEAARRIETINETHTRIAESKE